MRDFRAHKSDCKSDALALIPDILVRQERSFYGSSGCRREGVSFLVNQLREVLFPFLFLFLLSFWPNQA